MDSQTASRTAIATAMMRACHTRHDPVRLIDDAWGERLVPDTARAAVLKRALAEMKGRTRSSAVRSAEAIVDDYLRSLPGYSNVILRSRYTEDALKDAASRGVRQYVVLGAGFDSFFLRRPRFAQDIDIYEIDHPATQELKLRRLAACNIAAPSTTHFVAADLGEEDLRSVLARSTLRMDAPAFFSWLGVTMYLSRDANIGTLRSIAECAAPGSELVFTYLDERMLEERAQSDEFMRLARAVASLHEPFVSGFDPPALSEVLLAVGLDLAEDLSGRQLLERYDGAGVNGFRSGNTSHVALARVLCPPSPAGP